jgi:alpha-tubulin suppressor-like RCC1 family protein
LRCAGLNSSGQLGDGTTSSKDTFVYVDDSQMTDPAIVSSGWSHTCAIDSSSQAWCFGSNSNGQLGTGSTTSRTTPTPVWFLDSPIPFAQISAGDYFTCALESTSDVSCWGKNDRGQIGDGTTIDRLTPVFVDLPSGHAYEQVTAGTRHACALADDGTVYCWGSSSNGQLGNGATIDLHTPVVALMPNAAVFIDAGGNTTCAIDVDGLLWCWGLNNRGQLGDGTTLDRLEPVQVSFP